MILAHATGMMVAVKHIANKNGTMIVQEICGGTTFKIKPEEESRKLFDGEDAVDKAQSWISNCVAEKKQRKK